MRSPLLYLFTIAIVVISGFYLSSQVSASTIDVTPSIVRLDLDTDKAEALIYYSNQTDSIVELRFQAEDFRELEDGGRLLFLSEKDAKNYRYSLSSWINFDRQSLTLLPKEKQAIKVTIDKDELSPGGHYASIQAEFVQIKESKTVQIKGVLSSLLFVRTSTGKEKEEAFIEHFSTVSNMLSFPKKAIIRFQNKGNVDLIPYGEIVITKGEKTIAKGIINENSLITLPESIRTYEAPLSIHESFVFPGTYKARLLMQFGKSEKKLEKEIEFVTFGTIPLYGWLGIVLLLIVGPVVVVKKRSTKK